MERSAALARLQAMIAMNTDPCLDAAVVSGILDQAKRADRYRGWPDTFSEWAASTALALGDRRVPTTRNGHYYAVTTAGTTATSEPAWPTTSGATVTSGTAVFTEAGATTWVQTWDLNWAAAECWGLKAGAASDYANFTADGQTMNPDKIYDHCTGRETYYRKRVLPSAMRVRPSLGRNDYANYEDY